jgi:hypothetical protein
MTNEKGSIVSVDVIYLVVIMLLTLCFLDAKNVLDLLFLVVVTFYYIRIKVYRYQKYH